MGLQERVQELKKKQGGRINGRDRYEMKERDLRGSSDVRALRPIDGPRAPLSEQLGEILRESQKTIYQLSTDTGIDGAYIWRIVRGQRVEVSREVLMLISIALVLDRSRGDQLIEMANRLLDAGGYKMLKQGYQKELE